jgi:uncharacterized protein YndB with AHSA1/START domain
VNQLFLKKYEMKNEPIIVERTFDAPSSKVWQAITDNNLMKQWYFELADFKPVAGFEFQFYGGPEDGTQYLHLCKVTEVVTGKKLAYSWRYDGYKGNTVVTFELFDEGNKTMIKLTHEGVETFPESNKDFAKANFVTGWTYIVGTSLKDFVEKE